MRTNNRELALSSLALASALELTEAERAALAGEFAHTTEIVNQLQDGGQ